MKKSLFVAVTIGTLLAGCASVQTIPLATSTDASFGEINALGQEQNALLTLRGLPSMTARLLQVAPDTTRWSDPRTGRKRSVPTSEVREIRFKKNRMVKGIAVGAGFGIAMALAAGNDCGPRDDEGCVSRLDLVPAGALVGGIVGGIVGARGEVKYRFEPSTGTQAEQSAWRPRRVPSTRR